MPSFISNSNAGENANERLPVGRWGPTWLLALTVALSVVAGWEVTLRMNGRLPRDESLDEQQAWALERSGLDRAALRPLALIGSSRMRVLPAGALGEATTRHGAQLAITGQAPLPVLRDLASDPRFEGDVICGVSPFFFFSPQKALQNTASGNVARAYVEQFRVQAWIEPLEQLLTTGMGRTFTFRHPEVAPIEVIRNLRHGRLFRPSARERGEAEKDPSALEQRLRAHWGGFAPPSEAELVAMLDEYEQLVERMKRRGNRVIFLRLPSSGVLRELETRFLPREQYWDRLLSASGAPGIHFEDHPMLQGYAQRDYSHVPQEQMPAFVRALALVLRPHLRAE